MLAPEEVFAGKGDIKEEEELTQAERKMRRANKKRKFKSKLIWFFIWLLKCLFSVFLFVSNDCYCLYLQNILPLGLYPWPYTAIMPNCAFYLSVFAFLFIWPLPSRLSIVWHSFLQLRQLNGLERRHEKAHP